MCFEVAHFDSVISPGIFTGGSVQGIIVGHFHCDDSRGTANAGEIIISLGDDYGNFPDHGGYGNVSVVDGVGQCTGRAFATRSIIAHDDEGFIVSSNRGANEIFETFPGSLIKIGSLRDDIGHEEGR